MAVASLSVPFRSLLPALAALALAPALAAPQAAPPAPSTQTPVPAATLRTGAQLVIVDVSIADRNGNPVHGLKAQDFVLTEDKTPQTLRRFDEHSAADRPAAVEIPRLPPGNFTNYTATPSDSTLNVLLIDTLNTPTKDQSFLRNQLAEYVKKARPGARIAIFGMSSRLFLLQGFTSDPETLKNAVEHKLIPRTSALLDDPTGSNVDTAQMSDVASDAGAPSGVVSSLQQFEAEQQSFQTQLRMRYTLDAFNAMAHYLAAFPGRKNLIWFSGSFPISISPDPDITDPFAVMGDVETEFHETTNLLARAQVAVYPVDARGLMTSPIFDAANSGAKYAKNPAALGKDISKFTQSQADEHGTMQEMAADTGGIAFFNTNGLADATARAIDAGSNYYTLTYSPSNHNYNGAFRTIKVALSDSAKAQGYTLTYRHGYYADDPFNPNKSSKTASLSETAAAAPSTVANYTRLAMQRGAPTPNEILIKVRVLPDADKTSDKLASGNQLNPARPIKPPYRNFDVDLVALTRDMGFQKTTDGAYSDELEVKIFVYDTDGELLNVVSNAAKLNVKPDAFAQLLKSGVQYHAQVTAPARGESFFRIGIHDLNTNHFGVIEVPTSSVLGLPPAQYGVPAAHPAPPSK